jgi:hypothetical protein
MILFIEHSSHENEMMAGVQLFNDRPVCEKTHGVLASHTCCFCILKERMKTLLGQRASKVQKIVRSIFKRTQ